MALEVSIGIGLACLFGSVFFAVTYTTRFESMSAPRAGRSALSRAYHSQRSDFLPFSSVQASSPDQRKRQANSGARSRILW